jgi:hypothetical protein
MPEKPSVTELLTNFFSLVPLVLYTIVAIMLTIIAVFSLYDSAIVIYQLIVPPSVPVNLTSVINALLLTITIIVLFETVTVYFRTKHVEVRALLVAGLQHGRHRSGDHVCNRRPAGSPYRGNRSRQTRTPQLTP